MSWDVEFTGQFGDWWNILTAAEQLSIDNAVQLLERHGPALGRPLVDTIKGSAFPSMKELRPSSGNNRILAELEREGR